MRDVSLLFQMYERPPLSKEYLSGEKTIEKLYFFPNEVREKLNIDWYLEDEVVDINKFNKIVTLKSEKILAYDYLLLATGSEARIPVEEWKHMQNVFTLRNLEDSDELKKQLQPNKKLAVIGGGWIGLEIAATANQKGVSVSIFELASRLCQRSASEEISSYLKNLHEEKGSQIFFDLDAIRLFEKNNKQIEVYDNDELLMTADFVVVGAGAKLNTELAEKIGLEIQNNAIKFGYQCQTNDKFIYAAGDVAIHPDLGVSVQSYQNAQNQGIVAAKNMLGIEAYYKDIPWLWSDQFGNNIQVLGVPPKSEVQCIKRVTSERQKSYFYLNSENRLQFVFSINDAKSIKLSKKWMQANLILPIEDIQNPDFNLMTLKP